MKRPAVRALEMLDELDLPDPEDFDDDPDPDPSDDWGDESGCCCGTVDSRMPEKPPRTLDAEHPVYIPPHPPQMRRFTKERR